MNDKILHARAQLFITAKMQEYIDDTIRWQIISKAHKDPKLKDMAAENARHSSQWAETLEYILNKLERK